MREALNGVDLTQIDSLDDLANELKKKSNSRGLKRHVIAFDLKIEVLKKNTKEPYKPMMV
ncbi:hypothetical protein HPHPP1_1148 [Helicobacter pylori Hp P-1]|nr:hypothetical protein HPHPP1_1148 [Helicobacter pylori Hp P-1]EJC20407.1 hypothetical protein HPHPP1B_1229 [Helicobacter pylori Hp P-1b]